ncbi:hypothetical protein B7L68_01000 [Thermoproteus sp. CP80]|jgi:hypothetical protein|uniref:hypothetical protein n=1 Tax=Thermoproteus sp. CP80 TaxID=1650659 RepID=UPI000749C198|nr:hypothetical protein [Thermoproteus sp. CP80]KUO85698.1 MAG: hypothetical protein AT711_05875 [Thermoproteus sp. CIS_19]PLC67114.1 hypothetical protein B7L68_01000 [Thermoproteus sp. CP80]
MISVESAGGLVKIKAVVAGREYTASGLRSDYPAVVGLLFIQMLKDGVSLDDICKAVREALQHL